MKIMMFAHAGSVNRGCEAIVRSSSKIIKSKINNAYISLASDKPESDVSIIDLEEIFDSLPQALNISFINRLICGIELKTLGSENYALGKIYNKIISRISDVDVCLSIGGDNYCYGEQPWLYEIDRRVKKKGKKLILWACSIGEEDLTPRMIEDLKRFDLILARESLTYNLLKERGLHHVKLCADPAFTLEKVECPLPKGWKEGDTIGLNFSPLAYQRNKIALAAIEGLIQHILEHTESTIALTPHVMIHGNNDFELLNTYYEKFKETKRVIILPDNLNAMEYKGYIARMKYFIGARTHATIAAYSSLVPTMVLGYSIKSRGIAKDLFGEEKLVLGIDEISDTKKLITTFRQMQEEEKSIKETLEDILPKIKEKSYQLADYLIELASH